MQVKHARMLAQLHIADYRSDYNKQFKLSRIWLSRMQLRGGKNKNNKDKQTLPQIEQSRWRVIFPTVDSQVQKNGRLHQIVKIRSEFTANSAENWSNK